MLLRRLILTIVLIYLVALGTGMMFDHLYKKRWQDIFITKMDRLVDPQAKDEIVFLGNSRIHFGINPYYVDSITGIPSYNYGLGGGNMAEAETFSHILGERKALPRLLVIGIDESMIATAERYEKRYLFLQYLDNPHIRKHVRIDSFPGELIHVFPFLKYSFLSEYERNSLFTKDHLPKFEHNVYNGFINADVPEKAIDHLLFDTTADTRRYSAQAVQELYSMTEAAKKKGMQVVLIVPPYMTRADVKKTVLTDQLHKVLEEAHDNYGIRIFNMNRIDSFPNTYFTDYRHLNELGSRSFSRLVGDSLKVLLHP